MEGIALPHGWRHSVTDWARYVDRDACYSQILVDEFAPRYWAATVELTRQDVLRLNAEQVREHTSFQYEIACLSLGEVIRSAWAFEVPAADAISGE